MKHGLTLAILSSILLLLGKNSAVLISILTSVWILLKVKPVYAYEDYTHWGLTATAIGRLRGHKPYSSLKEVNKYLSKVENIDSWFNLPDQKKKSIISDVGKSFESWSTFINSIPSGTQGILWGSIAEDYLGEGADIDMAIVQNHYYNLLTGGGLSDWEGANDFGQLYGPLSLGNLARKMLARNPSSATVRAQTHWDLAKKAYESGSIRDAYSLLGRVVHLLEDMTESAHTRNDNHLGSVVNINFPEYNDHLYWTVYEKWCDSIPTPIKKDTQNKPHPFQVAIPPKKPAQTTSDSDRLTHEQREELSDDPQLFIKYQSELKSGKLHLDFMNFARKKGWKVELNHDNDKNKDFYFKMAKGGEQLGTAVVEHNKKWGQGHHSPVTNENNSEEKVADQWSILLRSPMIRDRWINQNKIQSYSSMKDLLDAFQEQGFFLGRDGSFESDDDKQEVDQKWSEGRKLVEEYLREKHQVDPENVTIEDFMNKMDETQIDDKVEEEQTYIPGEVKKYFPYLSSKFQESFNENSIPSSWDYIWGGLSGDLPKQQIPEKSLDFAYGYVKKEDARSYLEFLGKETAANWFSEDTIPGNLTCPQTYPELRDAQNEDLSKTEILVKKGFMIDSYEYIKDQQDRKITEDIILEEMKKVANAKTEEEKEKSYAKYSKMNNTIFPKDKEKNRWELLHRRRYRTTLEYAKEMAKDRFPKVTDLAAALIQAFYDSVNHIDIRKDEEEKDRQGNWRKNVINVKKQPGENEWKVDIWVENCGGVKEDVQIEIGEIPEKWRIEVEKIEGCTGVTGKIKDRVWVGKVKNVEPTPEKIADKGNIGSPWFYESMAQGIGKQIEKIGSVGEWMTRKTGLSGPYDYSYGTDEKRTRGAKLSIIIKPPEDEKK